jgi:DNA-binding LacI/PurR family transcriptional regulator
MANIREVARVAEVSPSTVSRVFRGTVPVNGETRERVIKAASQLQYKQPELVKGDYHFGIIVPQISAHDLPNHPTLYSITTQFVAELDKRQIRNSMVVIGDQHLANIESLFMKKMNGYLIMGTNQEQEDVLLPFLDAQGSPYVLLNRWLNDKHVNYVNIDDVQASVTATNHLISLKHKKIAFVGGDENFRNSQLRLKGFRQACREAGIIPPEEYIIQGRYNEASGYEAAEKLLSLKCPPDAGFFTSDILAIGFQRALQERGIPMPEKFAIVGYGDIPLARYVSPKLTTIRMPTEEMGRQSALTLLNLIQNPLIASVQILMKASLMIRESCGTNNQITSR